MWGGNEKWLATLAEGLAARGHRVVVSCRADGVVPGELRRRGIATATARPGAWGDLVRGARFAVFLRRERPDVLLLTAWRNLPWGVWAARLAGVPRTVVRLGIVRTPGEGWRGIGAFRRGVDALIVNSAEVRDAWFAAAPWFPRERVHRVLNGVAPAARPGAGERAALRAELGVSPGARVIAAAGVIAWRKGFDVLLEAFARAAVADAELLLVGDGPDVPELRARARALGINARVRWAGRRADVPRVLGACDLFVVSSRSEGMANVMLEAMAVGTPVVSTAVSGVREALGAHSGRPAAGWTVPVDDAGALAAALRHALGDRAEAAAFAAEAGWRARNWFAVERMVDEAEAVLAGTAPPSSAAGDDARAAPARAHDRARS